jgi:hypothetical protein
MFYSLVPPDAKPDQVQLYPTPDAAFARHQDQNRLYAVAVAFDERARLAMPLSVDAADPDPVWTARAFMHGDGSITVEGRIPNELFLLRLWT